MFSMSSCLPFLVRRTCLKATFGSVTTPAEAGRQAAALAAKLRGTARLPSSAATHSPHVQSMLAHAGLPVSETDGDEPYHNIPMSPPLHMATTYTRPPDGEYLDTDSIYSRHDNPTRLRLEQEIARLDGHGLFPSSGPQPRSFAWSSGMMAATGLVLAHQAPLTVLLPIDLYHGVSTVLFEVFTRFGVTIKQVDWRSLENHKLATSVAEIPPDHTVLVWLETPSNPMCHVIDIEEVCHWVHTHIVQPATIVVDSTLAPPTIQQPLAYPVDVVMHSATKYLAGHSDALIGTLTTNPLTEQGQKLATRLSQVQTMTGGVASTLDSWLCLRGLRTLAVRVQQQCATAQTVASFLASRVPVVHYPGLSSHPQHSVAQKQMKGNMYGGVMSIDMGSEERAMALAAALHMIQRATSLGGTETLIEHRASIEPPGRVSSPPGLLRLSVGLENANDLVRDLEQGLDIVEQVCGNSV